MSEQSRFEDCIIIHKKKYKDSYILTLWFKNLGRMSAMARSDRNYPYGYQIFSLLHLYVNKKQNSDFINILSIDRCEYLCSENSVGEHMFRLHINEILYRVLTEGHISPTLFDNYLDLIANINRENRSMYLVRFKMLLLESLGYGLQCRLDEDNNPIKSNKNYTGGIMGPFADVEYGVPMIGKNKKTISGSLILNLDNIENLRAEDIENIGQLLDDNISILTRHPILTSQYL